MARAGKLTRTRLPHVPGAARGGARAAARHQDMVVMRSR